MVLETETAPKKIQRHASYAYKHTQIHNGNPQNVSSAGYQRKISQRWDNLSYLQRTFPLPDFNYIENMSPTTILET